jgi:outer membrane protein OmpA-like peptidoglycan-associated protein
MGRIRPIAKQHEPERIGRQPIDATPELGTLAMARPLLFVNLLLAFAAHAALAQEVRVYRADETVDPQEVARILDTKPAPQIKMRSLHVLDDEPAAKASPKATGSRAAHKDALSLPIQFAFNSAEVAPSARGQLDALADGIRMLPAGQKVVIEGHTDAIGSDHYNNELSLRRANAVMHYLVALQHIEPDRLRAEGLGRSAPLPGHDPKSAENRRVQFRGE